MVYLMVGAFLYIYHAFFANSSFFFASVTFIVGSLAFYIYTQQKADNKRDSARLIIQEIRRAEDIINNYKTMGSYQFSKKIIATNSWTKNIHFFVGDLDNDELDKISDLYSTGEYLDSLVKDVSKITFEHQIESVKKVQQQILLPPEGSDSPAEVVIPQLPPIWKARLDIISKQLEPIYHSTILRKLKNIAELS